MSQSPKLRAENDETTIAGLKAALDWGGILDGPQALAHWVIERSIAIQQIPAPTFDEARRATFVAEQFAVLGLDEISIDERFNVYGRLHGQDATLPGIIICAHTDTVFPYDSNLSLRHEPDRIIGPGLGDNSLGVGGMLGLLEGLRRLGVKPACDLYLVATTREEGLGNLDGIRMAYERLADKIGAVINIEGLSLGFVYNAGIAVRRLKITAVADGGHSWVHFGRRSAINGIMQLGARILSIDPPNEPRTTYNLGMINGGHAINAIATQAELWLDMRSESPDALNKLEAQVRGHINRLTEGDLRFEVEVVGDRPAGCMAADHPLVRLALEALDAVQVNAGLHSGSTDGNVPLAAGCPTVTVGITTGGNAHRLDEFIDTAPVARGMQHLLLLVLVASQQVSEF